MSNSQFIHPKNPPRPLCWRTSLFPLSLLFVPLTHGRNHREKSYIAHPSVLYSCPPLQHSSWHSPRHCLLYACKIVRFQGSKEIIWITQKPLKSHQRDRWRFLQLSEKYSDWNQDQHSYSKLQKMAFFYHHARLSRNQLIRQKNGGKSKNLWLKGEKHIKPPDPPRSISTPYEIWI